MDEGGLLLALNVREVAEQGRFLSGRAHFEALACHPPAPTWGKLFGLSLPPDPLGGIMPPHCVFLSLLTESLTGSNLLPGCQSTSPSRAFKVMSSKEKLQRTQSKFGCFLPSIKCIQPPHSES